MPVPNTVLPGLLKETQTPLDANFAYLDNAVSSAGAAGAAGAAGSAGAVDGEDGEPGPPALGGLLGLPGYMATEVTVMSR